MENFLAVVLGVEPHERFVDGVTVVWVAKQPYGGLRVVGWYTGARLYRSLQDAPSGSGRRIKGERGLMGFFAAASPADVVCLERSERIVAIPRNRPGAMGQSNVWFADSSLGRATAKRVEHFIRRYRVHARSQRPVRAQRNSDVLRRTKVEIAAIDAVCAHYTERNFRIRDVQRDRCGWDLEARKAGETRLIEVKGLSGPDAVAELTPGEYTAMRKKRQSYALCIVTNALKPKARQLRIFEHDGRTWRDQNDCALMLTEMVGLRVRA